MTNIVKHSPDAIFKLEFLFIFYFVVFTWQHQQNICFEDSAMEKKLMWTTDIQPVSPSVVQPNLIQFYSQRMEKVKGVNTSARHCISSIKPLRLDNFNFSSTHSFLHCSSQALCWADCWSSSHSQAVPPYQPGCAPSNSGSSTPGISGTELCFRICRSLCDYVRVLFNVWWAWSFTMRAYVRPRPTNPAESSLYRALLIDATAAISTTNAPMYSWWVKI